MLQLSGAQAIDRVLEGLSFRTDLRNQVLLRLKEAQAEFEAGQTLPSFLLLEDQSLTVSSGQQSVTLPSNFLRLYENNLPHYVDSAEKAIHYLVRRPRDEAELYYAEFDAGAPMAFVMRNTDMLIYPVPDSSYTLTWSYYRTGDTIADDSSIPLWLANNPMRLVGKAGMTLAMELEHDAAVERFTKMYAEWTAWQQYKEADEESAGMPRAMGRNK